MKVYIVLSVFAFSLYGMLYIAEAAPNVTAGNCLNVTLLNTTTNASSNETICALFPLRNITKVLGYGELLNISEENLTVVGPPLAVSPVQICEFITNVTPNVGLENFTYANKTDGPCRVLVTVLGAPIPVIFQVPPEFILLPRNESEKIFNASLQLGNISDDNAILRNENFLLKDRVEGLERSVCNINNKVLLDGYKSLSTNSKTYLKQFARLNEFVSVTQFSDFIDPEATGQARANIDFFTNIALEQYEQRGFAEVKAIVLEQTRTGNLTLAVYKPLITEGCVGKLESLQGIYDDGKSSGHIEIIIVAVLMFVAFFISMTLASRAPPGALR